MSTDTAQKSADHPHGRSRASGDHGHVVALVGPEPLATPRAPDGRRTLTAPGGTALGVHVPDPLGEPLVDARMPSLAALAVASIGGQQRDRAQQGFQHVHR